MQKQKLQHFVLTKLGWSFEESDHEDDIDGPTVVDTAEGFISF